MDVQSLREIADHHVLDRFELQVLLVLVAPVLHAEMAILYSRLDGDTVCTPRRIAACLGVDRYAPALRRALDPDSVLTRHGLIVQDLDQPWSGRAVALHPRILPRLRRDG
jgi:hypothetical protein